MHAEEQLRMLDLSSHAVQAAEFLICRRESKPHGFVAELSVRGKGIGEKRLSSSAKAIQSVDEFAGSCS